MNSVEKIKSGKRLLVLFVGVVILPVLAGFFLQSIALAEYSGHVGVEARVFTESGKYAEQSDDVALSFVAEPGFHLSSTRGEHQLAIVPFVRLDSVDDDRSHVDIREGYYRYISGDYRFLTGVNRLFWGVAESRHLVDIINQSDPLEDVDFEEKLGQPMIQAGLSRDWGDLDFFLLPYFRERRFPGESGRLRFPMPVGEAVYESGAKEYHQDIALRYSHYMGDWDIGGSYFYGTSREPLLKANSDGSELIPYYGIIHQLGLDLQYTRKAWLWKFEGIVRDTQNSTFAALVGGFEYTYYQIGTTDADLGILLEYNLDGRDDEEEPATPFDNDLFLGSRLALNDLQNTTVLFGILVDTDNGSSLVSLEAERRLGESWVVEITARIYTGVVEDDPLNTFERDSFINFSLQYHF